MNGGRLSHRRPVQERIIIRGQLTLNSPTCFSNGDTDSPTDLGLIRDSISDHALLTGASLAGALRNYLWEYRCGYPNGPSHGSLTVTRTLFGDIRSVTDEENSRQSPLIINNAVSNKTPRVELRDGVKIDPALGTAADKAKYDLELIAAGTTFSLYFELLIETEHDREQLLEDLAIVLTGLESGEIAMGMKKRRGFGQCSVSNWQIWHFDLTKVTDRYNWLTHKHWLQGPINNYPTYNSIETALNSQSGTVLKQSLSDVEDKRKYFELTASFSLQGSLLIRSAATDSKRAPDVVHLASLRNGENVPVLSGTSLTGVLRNRAIRILNTLGQDIAFIDELFGPDLSEDKSIKPKASRLVVKESEITKVEPLVQNRIAIDRFTGGALDGALFNEQPVFGQSDSKLTIELNLRNPKESEIGLLLLLLKDLWTGDLPIGGESSIGRGRLKGQKAEMTHKDSEPEKRIWSIQQTKNGLDISNAQSLNHFVTALVTPTKDLPAGRAAA